MQPGRYASCLHAVALRHNAFLDAHSFRHFHDDTPSRAPSTSSLRGPALHEPPAREDHARHSLSLFEILARSDPCWTASTGYCRVVGGAFLLWARDPYTSFLFRGRNGRTALQSRNRRRGLGSDEGRRGGCRTNKEDSQRRISAAHTR